MNPCQYDTGSQNQRRVGCNVHGLIGTFLNEFDHPMNIPSVGNSTTPRLWFTNVFCVSYTILQKYQIQAKTRSADVGHVFVRNLHAPGSHKTNFESSDKVGVIFEFIPSNAKLNQWFDLPRIAGNQSLSCSIWLASRCMGPVCLPAFVSFVCADLLEPWVVPIVLLSR